MKNITRILILALTVIMVSCNSNEVRIYNRTSAQDAVGVYVGQWHGVAAPSSVIPEGIDTLYDGELEFEVYKDSIANVCFIYTRCPALSDFPTRGLANVSHAGDDIVFNNDKDSGNGIGSNFFGRISGDGTVTMSFTTFSKVPIPGSTKKKTIGFDYTFTGKKQ